MVHAALPRAARLTFALRSLTVLALTMSCDEPESESVGSAQQAASCRTIELQVSRAPGQAWTTDEASLSPAMTFLLPERVEVTANNTGLHDVWLEIRNGEVDDTCRYRARSKAVGQAHQFVACTSGAVPGDELDATWVGLSAEGSPATITLTLREELPCDGGGGGARA